MATSNRCTRPDMRALTIRQRWAALIVHGPKRIENHTRKPWTRLVGRLIGIHAARRVDEHSEAHMARRYWLREPLPHDVLRKGGQP